MGQIYAHTRENNRRKKIRRKQDIDYGFMFIFETVSKHIERWVYWNEKPAGGRVTRGNDTGRHAPKSTQYKSSEANSMSLISVGIALAKLRHQNCVHTAKGVRDTEAESTKNVSFTAKTCI